MKDIDKLDEIYRSYNRKEHAHRLGLLGVYDEGWSDGRQRAVAEALKIVTDLIDGIDSSDALVPQELFDLERGLRDLGRTSSSNGLSFDQTPDNQSKPKLGDAQP